MNVDVDTSYDREQKRASCLFARYIRKFYIQFLDVEMMITKSIYPVTRIEADGKLVLHVNDEDVIIKGFFYPFMPIRGFERMLIGKTLEFLPVGAMRICGVCHITHGIAAVEAAENALGVIPPENGLILREIAGLGNRLQSHALHMLFLYKDFFEGNDKLLRDIFNMLECAGEIVKISGHSPVHPPNVCVGGMRRNISEKGKEEIERNAIKYKNLMEKLENLLKEILEKMVDENKIPKNLGNVNLPLLATHPYYGDREEIDLLDLNVVPPEKYYDVKEIRGETGATVVLYRNELAEVGPKARMKKFFKFSSNLPLMVNITYMEDAIKGCERIIELCDLLNVSSPTKATVSSKNGRGVGVHEAPRGTNIHVVKLRDDGIIVDYRIIVPTMFNLAVIDTALIGAPYSYAEVIVRSYDPCLSCATHVTVIKDGVVKNIGVMQ